MVEDPVAEPLERLLRNLGSDQSRRAYENDWGRYVAWLKDQKVAVTATKPRHIEDHIIHLRDDGCKRSTCGRALSVIRAVYGILVRDEVMETNPAREVKNPKFNSSPNTPHLSKEQLGRLLSLPADTWEEQRDHLCICLLCGLGFRRAEVAALRVGDFRDAPAGTMKGIVKGGKRIVVGVPPWLQKKLAAWIKYKGEQGASAALLPRSEVDSRAVTGDIVYKIVREAAAKIGVKLSPHGLRRTLITLGREHGIDLKTLQLAVGHSSQATTEKYDKDRDASKNAPGYIFANLFD